MNRRSTPLIAIACFLALWSVACDPQEQERKVQSLETDVKQLKADVAELKRTREEVPQHHYELRTQGFRTWRFDPATGDTCVQLTTDADWKRKETKSQSCVCTDSSDAYMKMPEDTEQQQKNAARYYDRFVKVNCGED